MLLEFDEEAKRYISEKGNVIQIYSASGPGCCGAAVIYKVKPGPPPEKDQPHFKKVEVDGVTVYIAGHLYNEKIKKRIDIQRLLFMKELILE